MKRANVIIDTTKFRLYRNLWHNHAVALLMGQKLHLEAHGGKKIHMKKENRE